MVEVKAAAAEARHEADLELQKANTAERMRKQAEASLAAAEQSGDMAAVAAAEQDLAHANTAATREKQEAELAEAQAATAHARVMVEIEQIEAHVDEKEAQDAEMAVVRAEAILKGSLSEGCFGRLAFEEALEHAKAAAVHARNEASVTEAEAELARSQLDANENIARALKENFELQAAKQKVLEATATLELANQEDTGAVSQAEFVLATARAALEKEQGEAQVADATAAVTQAQVVADEAAARALDEKLQAQHAEELVHKAQEALAESQLQTDRNSWQRGVDIERANQALAEATTAADREQKEAEAAATEAEQAETLAAVETEAARALMDRVEARAADNANVSMAEDKYLKCYSMFGGLFLVVAVFFIGFGGSFVVYTLASRVIDNNKMLVTAADVCESLSNVITSLNTGALSEPEFHATCVELADPRSNRCRCAGCTTVNYRQHFRRFFWEHNCWLVPCYPDGNYELR